MKITVISSTFNKLFSLVVLCSLFVHGIAHAKINREVHTLHHYHFSVPVGLESKVEFWKKVYSEYSTDHYIVHDMNDLSIVYDVFYIKNGSKMSNRSRERRLNRFKKKYRKLLLQIARTKDPLSLKGDAKRVYNLVKPNFKRASRNIRVQVGQKDRFRAGIERSGSYQNRINGIFSKAGLPLELTVLPHVESSFQVNAYSSAGAAGIWQFTRGTGRLFMRVGYDVDERRDPILSTIAASKLLKLNFETLRSWPLAITAYNHGTQGIKRAKKRYGTNIVDVVNGYRSRTFGFASKNFYAEFLAALYVVKNSDKHFPGIVLQKPLNIASITIKDFVHINSIMKHFNMTRDDIAKFNPALRRPVISGQKRIPKNFMLQAPKNRIANMKDFYQAIPENERYKNQIRSNWYTVRRGDTLSGVASRFKTSVNKLYSHNNLSHRNKIYISQVLRLPPRKGDVRNFYRTSRKNSKPYVGDTAIYKVRHKDNLTKIARRFDTGVSQLIGLNSIGNPNQIRRGQLLKVPFRAKKSSKSKNWNANNKKSNKINIKNNIKDFEVEAALLNSIDKVNKDRPAFLPVSFTNGGKVVNSSAIGLVVVDFDETLSHFAEWSKLTVKKLLKVNRMNKRSQLNVHTKLKVPFTKVTPEAFEERRQEFHKAIQEDFFNNFKIDRLMVRNIKKGETIWEICNDLYSIPFWLVASYNPGKDIYSIPVGDPIVVPAIIPVKSS